MSDDDTLDMYLAGYYIYSVYSDNNTSDNINKNNNNKDNNINTCDAFYLILGWVIKEFYPECFVHITYML